MLDGEILDQARERLSAALPDYLRLQAGPSSWSLEDPDGGRGELAVVVARSPTPREAQRLASAPPRLVVARFLSPRSRDLLAGAGHSYLDLTGNVHVRVARPAVYVRLQGADRDPAPLDRSPIGLRGPKARRLLRLMIDFAPPYRPIDLARAGRLNKGYVSSLLDALDERALIERGPRGAVEDVDWAAMTIVAADGYRLLHNNKAAYFVAPSGAMALGARLAEAGAPPAIVTGSFAAAAVRPVAAPAQLVLYSADPAAVRRFGGLLPAERGADVVLLQAEDEYQLLRTREVRGVAHVALSQLVLDCLGGNGRLPEEGSAVLDWMRAGTTAWRSPRLHES